MTTEITDPATSALQQAQLRLIAQQDLWLTEQDVEDILEANDLADRGWCSDEPEQTQETTAE